MSLNDYARKKFDELWREGESRVEEVLKEPYTLPSDEPLTWDTRGVVQLHAAKMAAQLLAGRISQRIVPAVIEARLAATMFAINGYVGGKLTARGVPKLAWFVSLLQEVIRIWGDGKIEAIIEAAIRRNSLEIRRELLSLKLGGKKARVVKTCWVYSRKHTPKQRRENKAWTDRRN